MPKRDDISRIQAAQAGDHEAFNELAKDYMPLIHSLAKRATRRFSWWYDEAVGDGMIGFIRGVRTWGEPKKFTGWVAMKTFGAIIDGVREHLSIVHIPPGQFRAGVRIRFGRPEAIEWVADHSCPEARIESEDHFDRLLWAATPQERDVLRGIYARGLNQQEIADLMGFGPTRISQLQASGLGQLRYSLGVQPAHEPNHSEAGRIPLGSA